MHKLRYALFFDNHTQMENPDVGKNFDPEYFTDEIKKCGVDCLTFHARCNVGMAYYNTKMGIRHPSLSYDLFGRLAECCHKKDIALVAYLNGGISTMEAVWHRDWTVLSMPGTGCFGQNTPYAMTMCYNSPFRAHIISMIREIASGYPVEGFFIDCVATNTCVCPTCVAQMKECGFDWSDRGQVEEFSRQSALRFCDEIAAAVREIIPDPMLYFNGPVFGSVTDSDTFFDCECLPTAGWGYEHLPTMAHYMRNIKPDTQILNMTGRFYDWGDFGGLRTAESLKFDLFYGLAHGMRPNIGGHFHPRGDKDQAVFDRIREVYHELQKYDEWYSDAKNPADIAIVYPQDQISLWLKNPVRSAVRMLEELKMQFDIVLADRDKTWDHYKLLILPENVEITKHMIERIRSHIVRGGAFFACGRNAAEKFSMELGIEYLGDSGLDPVYFQMNGEFNMGLDDMYLSLYAPAAKARLTDARGASRLVKPYYNTGWNGSYAICYTPPQEQTDMPFITRNTNCIWCSGDLFSGYMQHASLHLRDIVRNIIGILLEKPLLKVENLPAFVRLILAEQEKRLNIHLTAYVPEKRHDAFVVEDPIAVVNGRIRVLTSGRKVKRVYFAPDYREVDFSTEGDYTAIVLPLFAGFALVSIEFE